MQIEKIKSLYPLLIISYFSMKKMEVQTIKSGKCPVCGSSEIYDNREKNPANQRKFILVSAIKSFSLVTYVCISCGYFKEFIEDKDLANEKLKAKVKEKWNKTNSMTNAR
jgi:hypothetical protein